MGFDLPGVDVGDRSAQLDRVGWRPKRSVRSGGWRPKRSVRSGGCPTKWTGCPKGCLRGLYRCPSGFSAARILGGRPLFVSGAAPGSGGVTKDRSL